MKTTRNLILALITIGFVYFLLTTDFDKDERHPVTTTPSASQKPESKPLFDAESVTGLSWSFRDKTMDFKKIKDQWTRNGEGSLDDDARWGVVRRIAILARSGLSPNVKVPAPWGHFKVIMKSETWDGIYDGQAYVWTAGPQAGKGLSFSADPDLKDIFGEGLFGFQSHQVKWCQSSTVKELDFNDQWSLKKQKNKWITWRTGQKEQPGRKIAIEGFLKQICEVKADLFIADPGDVSKGLSPALTISSAQGRTAVRQNNHIYVSNKAPAFRSHDLDVLMTTSLDDLTDPSLEEGKIALDPSKTTKERIAAIRKIKTMRSVEGIPALKALIFEKTNVDVYRYEAVDALAAIGTKEAFKIIADRLAQVGRSGFELRLARALSAAMGRVFKSDENTPDNVRRAEVNDLLEAYKKSPPGI